MCWKKNHIPDMILAKNLLFRILMILSLFTIKNMYICSWLYLFSVEMYYIILLATVLVSLCFILKPKFKQNVIIWTILNWSFFDLAIVYIHVYILYILSDLICKHKDSWLYDYELNLLLVKSEKMVLYLDRCFQQQQQNYWLMSNWEKNKQ